MSEWAPLLAPVRPRVVRPGSVLPRLLEEEVAELLQAGKPVELVLWGHSGIGKSTALAHLAAVFPEDAGLQLCDGDTVRREGSGIVSINTMRRQPGRLLAFQLQAWTEDDVIDYLLARHPDAVARVVPTWRSGPPHDLLDWPGLCRAVLDQLVENATVKSPRSGVVAVLADRIEERDYMPAVEFAKYMEVKGPKHNATERAFPTALEDLRSVLGSATARGVLIADYLLQFITLQFRRSEFFVRWSEELRYAVTDAMHHNVPGRDEIVDLAAQPRVRQKALLYSALTLLDAGFRPARAFRGNMKRAWIPKIDIHDHRVRADLSGANLDGANLDGTLFERSRMDLASIRGAHAEAAAFSRLAARGLQAARLEAPGSVWQSAMLHQARFHGAILDRASFYDTALLEADFTFAKLRGATLDHANLRRTQFDHADLTDASLKGALARNVDWRQAQLIGAQLQGAKLFVCNFAGADMPAVDASYAQFCNCDLTSVNWENGDLRFASFSECGLADVNWEGADLRDVDLRRSTFHLGNSRSGLIDSTIASEGSRTGYYTDESLEDRFQAPEDVRKANLRNCDLRGANILGVDFYLVDLRGAKLDSWQRRWLERCRAILDRADQ